ncbi:MAG: dihydrofolate reductase family protein, partial [Bacteroidota bacterium]
ILLEQRGVRVVQMETDPNGMINLRQVLKRLGDEGIISLLVEGGQHVFTEFLRQGLVDRMFIFIAPRVYGCSGLPAFRDLNALKHPEFLELSSFEAEKVGSDILIHGYIAK